MDTNSPDQPGDYSPSLHENAEISTASASDGIPVIAVDVQAPPTAGITTFVGNDNIGAGALLADEAIKHILQHAGGTVVVGIDTPRRADSYLPLSRH
jgi:ABC-type sugar transport system substrate-binding protein